MSVILGAAFVVRKFPSLVLDPFYFLVLFLTHPPHSCFLEFWPSTSYGSYLSTWDANLLLLWISENVFILASLEVSYLINREFYVKSLLRIFKAFLYCLLVFSLLLRSLKLFWFLVLCMKPIFYSLWTLIPLYYLFFVSSSRISPCCVWLGVVFVFTLLLTCWDITFCKFTLLSFRNFFPH